MANEVRWRLRDATAEVHQRLEDRLDIFARIATPAGRRDLAQRFHALHTAAEAALASHLTDVEGLDFQSRRRTPHLTADLAALGASAIPGEPMACTDRGTALGWMYVLEGSTLGGKVIGRRVTEAGGDMAGLSFLDPYGDQGGVRWREFLEAMEREAADPVVAERMIEGALAAFRHAEAVLCERQPA